MTNSSSITNANIAHLATLAKLSISDDRFAVLANQIKDTFSVIDTLQKTDVSKYQDTNQVSGLTNVLREDIVDESRTLSQADALKNAKSSYQGYFLVPAVLE